MSGLTPRECVAMHQVFIVGDLLPAPVIGLDFDGLLKEAVEFVRMLTSIWPADVIVFSENEARQEIQTKLDEAGIRYDELVIVESTEAKNRAIQEKQVPIYFTDRPEQLSLMPAGVQAFLYRPQGPT